MRGCGSLANIALRSTLYVVLCSFHVILTEIVFVLARRVSYMVRGSKDETQVKSLRNVSKAVDACKSGSTSRM